jgi:hypothetical protein
MSATPISSATLTLPDYGRVARDTGGMRLRRLVQDPIAPNSLRTSIAPADPAMHRLLSAADHHTGVFSMYEMSPNLPSTNKAGSVIELLPERTM